MICLLDIRRVLCRSTLVDPCFFVRFPFLSVLRPPSLFCLLLLGGNVGSDDDEVDDKVVVDDELLGGKKDDEFDVEDVSETELSFNKLFILV